MSVRLEIEGARAHVLIDRADQRNAFNMAMWEELHRILTQTAANTQLRLMIIRAAEPGVFCAGADIKELLAHKEDGEWRAANQRVINAVQHALARHPLPTIAFVEGDCVGGGCGLAIACDLRVARPRARFGITPAKLGLVYPLHDVKLLVDLVGPGQAKRILYTGALLDAAEAQRIGLIEMVSDTPEDLAAAIQAASPHSIRESKKFIRRVLDGQIGDDEASLAIFAEAFTGSDFAEGTAAFVEKRKPEFGP